MKLMQLIVGLTVGILLFVGLLAPVVSDGQISVGTETTYENESALFKMADSGETVTISLSAGNVTLNGTVIEHTANSIILASDAFGVDQYYFENNWLTRVWYKDSTALNYPTAFELTFASGTVSGTITSGGSTTTFEEAYSYVYYADPAGKYSQYSSAGGIDIYVNDTKQIVLSGLYYTGDNDTTYEYIDGVLSIAGDYETSITFESEKVGLDVLHITGITVNIGNESFTPYRYMVLSEVTGHSSTVESSLIGVIGFLAIISLIAFAAFAVRGRMND